MLMAKLIHKQRQAVELHAAIWQQQHRILQIQHGFFKQRLAALCTSFPALGLSFSAGFIMQARHHNAVKSLRRLIGFSWLRSILR